MCRLLIRRSLLTVLFLGLVLVATGWLGKRIPVGFLPDEDQGYLYANLSLPEAASLERTDNAAKQVEQILLNIPGVDKVTTVSGYSLLSSVTSTYNAFFFVTLKEWKEAQESGRTYWTYHRLCESTIDGLSGGTCLRVSTARPFPVSAPPAG